jgi:hypothetical protein
MKMKGLYILIFFLMMASSAMAYDWKSAGFEETDSGSKGDENFLVFTDSNSLSLKVRFQGELSDSWAEKIVELNKKFSEWKYMKPGNISYYITGDTLEILIIPSQFNYLGSDFIPYIPGGMVFIYDYALRYNFRITKNDIFLRLNDKFTEEDLLCRRMKEALDDPIAYLKKREPEYFLQKLNELEADVALLRDSQDKLVKSVLYFQNSGFLGFGNTPIKTAVVKRIVELKSADPSFNKARIKETLEKEKIEATDQEIELVLNVLYNEFK